MKKESSLMNKISLSTNLPNTSLFLFSLLLFFYSPAFLASQTSGNGDKQIQFSTDEGTWLALDVSPDQKTIIFELLGDLYSIPFTGGKARVIANGKAFQSQPRFSPDGSQIVFISDESGSDNVWIMDANGENPNQLSAHHKELMLSPEWSADGRQIYVTIIKDGFNRMADLYSLELATKEEKLLVSNPNGRPAPLVSAPAPGLFMSDVHPNGESLLVSSVTPRAYGMRKGASAQVMSLDLASNQLKEVALDKGLTMKPSISKNGEWLAYAAQSQGQTGLRIRHLQSAKEKWLALPIVRNELEARPTRDVIPNYAFTPDNRFVIISFDGKIYKVRIEDGQKELIPFSVDVTMNIGRPLRFPKKLSEEDIQTRFIQQAAIFKQEKVAFSSLGKIYVSNLEVNQANAITQKMDSREFYPAWSADGQQLVFANWNDEGGHLWLSRVGENKEIVPLTKDPAFYAMPSFSSDGSKIIALRASLGLKRRTQFNTIPPESEFIEITLSNGKIEVLGNSDGLLYPVYSKNGQGFYACSPAKGIIFLQKGNTPKVVAKINPGIQNLKYTSMSNSLLAYGRNGMLYQLELNKDPSVITEPLDLNVFNDGKMLTDERPEDFCWSSDGKTMAWTVGADLNYQSLNEDLPQKQSYSLSLPRSMPSGSVLLRGATAITMKGKEIIADSDILIKNNRIEAIGARGSIDLAPNIEIRDVSNRYIIPGIIDIHAHLGLAQEVLEPVSPAMYANLAYGTTTVRDPQTSPQVFIYADMVEAGLVDGPRIFSTGPGIFSFDNLDSYEKMKQRLEIYAKRYKTHLIKSYLVGNRQQREWMVQACGELGLMPTTEGGADTKRNITHAIDGFSGIEHAVPTAPIFDDLIQLFAQSEITNTPTLLVAFGGPLPIYHTLAKENPYENSKLRYFIPNDQLFDRSATRLLYFREEDHHVKEVGKGINAILIAGGNIGLGGHGEMQGIQNHWEMWLLASGGMNNHDVLRVATLNSARAIGLDSDLGSLEPGKMADLIILEKNPLENIRNSTSIQFVMKNGFLYEGDTLNQVWPEEKASPTPWWRKEK